MQAAIDRVLRTFTLKHSPLLVEPMRDDRASHAQDQASAFAAQLLDNYKAQLTRRSVRQD